jgi:hypothetical protein
MGGGNDIPTECSHVQEAKGKATTAADSNYVCRLRPTGASLQGRISTFGMCDGRSVWSGHGAEMSTGIAALPRLLSSNFRQLELRNPWLQLATGKATVSTLTTAEENNRLPTSRFRSEIRRGQVYRVDPQKLSLVVRNHEFAHQIYASVCS